MENMPWYEHDTSLPARLADLALLPSLVSVFVETRMSLPIRFFAPFGKLTDTLFLLEAAGPYGALRVVPEVAGDVMQIAGPVTAALGDPLVGGLCYGIGSLLKNAEEFACIGASVVASTHNKIRGRAWVEARLRAEEEAAFARMQFYASRSKRQP